MGQHICKFPALRGEIVKVCGTQADFAMSMNLTKSTISKKMTGKVPWDSNEIENACRILKLDPATAWTFFIFPQSRTKET